ncbi:MAG: hypothetical protein RLZZ511_3502 [Cyanobacteriota bacterium]|jgi:hypothetical protein
MQKLTLIFASILTIASTLSPNLVNAQTPAPSAQTRQPTRGQRLKTHTIGNVTFKAPSHWLDRSDAADDITLHNQKPPKAGGGWAPKGSIKVMAQILNKSLDNATAPNPNERQLGRMTTKTEKLTIGGKAAIRIHEDYEDGFPGGITTYVATGEDETTMIITFYADRDTAKQVQQIHNSIRITE